MSQQVFLNLEEMELIKNSLVTVLEELNREIKEDKPAQSILDLINPKLETYKKMILYFESKIKEVQELK